jgi:hypothetical protein
LVLGYDPDLTAYLHNNTSSPFSFDGYQITSETKQLDPVGWKSIQDQVSIPESIAWLIDNGGVGIITFGEANPSPSVLAELNIASAATLQPDTKLYLGKPFGSGGYWVDFAYHAAGGGPSTSEPQRLYINPVPEPSTWLLAGLGGLGLMALRRRSRE